MQEYCSPVSKEASRAAAIDALMIDAERLAQLLDVSVSLVRKMDRSGKIPAPLKLGSCVRWRVDEIAAWVRADCPDRQRWAIMREAALGAGGRPVAPSSTMQKQCSGVAA